MQLDKEITEYSSDDGLLYINLSPYTDVVLRYYPWKEGLAIERRDGERWTKENYDPQIPLVTHIHQNSDLPVNNYIKDIPMQVQASVLKIDYLQTSILQLAAKSYKASELLCDAPVLLWMIADHLKNRDLSATAIDKMVGKKRTDILSEIVGVDSQASVKFIKKIQILNGDQNELKVIKNSAVDKHVTYALRNWKKIPIHILSVLRRYPEISESKLLRSFEEIEASQPLETLTHIFKIMNGWYDVMRLGQRLNINRNNTLNLLNRCKSEQDIQKLHDQWVYKSNKMKVCVEKGNNLFPSPPLPGDNHIIPILTEEDLIAEGRIMHHCVGSYSHSVRSGSCYIYRVLHPERATLELRCDNLRISQFKLASNQSPSNDSWKAVNRWLKKHKK